MENLRKKSVLMWIIGLSLVMSLIASCGRDHGQVPGSDSVVDIIEPYSGPCPDGQSSWDCMAWNQDKWE